jgi:hypothetical protein
VASSAAAQPAPTSAASADTQQRLQDLEKEVSALEQEIAALKASSTPAMTTAAYHPDASASAVSAPPARPDDPPQKVSIASLLGPVTFSGFVDGYYAFNFNQPTALGSNTNPSGVEGNTLRFFDQNTQQFSLNAIELVADKAPDATAGGTGRAGYHAGIIYGQAASTINGNFNNFGNQTDASNIALKEAYVDYIAPIGKGLTLTLGKFVTPNGAEVIESNANWNYSRSILFYYAIPFFHFGASAKYAFNNQWAVTGYLVNNWNGTQQFNTGKTYGVSLAWTPNMKWSVTENYMAGPQNDARLFGALGKPNGNWRQLEDATIAYTPNATWAFQVNGDYGYGDKFRIGALNSKPVDWWGAAAYAKYNFGSKAYTAVRYEYYSDPQGFTLGTAGGLANVRANTHVGEGTATFAYNLTSALQTRFEVRDDYSNRRLFQKGAGKFVFTQPIVELGFIYTFNSANAK